MINVAHLPARRHVSLCHYLHLPTPVPWAFSRSSMGSQQLELSSSQGQKSKMAHQSRTSRYNSSKKQKPDHHQISDNHLRTPSGRLSYPQEVRRHTFFFPCRNNDMKKQVNNGEYENIPYSESLSLVKATAKGIIKISFPQTPWKWSCVLS